MKRNEKKPKKSEPKTRKSNTKRGVKSVSRSSEGKTKGKERPNTNAKNKKSISTNPGRKGDKIFENRTSRLRSSERLELYLLQELESQSGLPLTSEKEFKREFKRIRAQEKADTKRERREEGTHQRVSEPTGKFKGKISVVKKRGDNVWTYEYGTKSLQQQILGINSSSMPELSKVMKDIPSSVVVILAIKKPGQKDLIYRSWKTPVDYSVSSKKAIKDFMAKVVSEYNNNTAEFIEENYDEPVRVWPIKKIGLRINFPIQSI